MNPIATKLIFQQPYPGLRPFLQSEAPLFFGRADDINRMLACLEKHRFLAVVGSSGSGKSSLVRAGLLPVLGQGYLLGAGTDWRFVVMKPGDDPFGNLAMEFQQTFSGGEAPDPGDIAFTQATLQASPHGFLDVLEEAGLDKGGPMLLLVDQFEEIFRFRRRNTGGDFADGAGRAIHEERNDATAFVNLLLTTAEAAAKAEFPIYVLLTMRSDFIGDCDVFPDLPQAVSDSQFLVPRMARRQIQEVIEKPMVLFDDKAAPDLVNQMLNDAGTDPDQLPLMQHALMRTWHAAQRRCSGQTQAIVLTRGDYSSVGGFSDALCRHLEEAWDSLDGDQERRIAQQLFLCLSERTAQGTLIRRMAKLREVAAVANAAAVEVAKVVRIFQEDGRNFIMASPWGELNSESVLDISHEALLRQWARLRSWLEEEAKLADQYVRLADGASRWKAGDAEPLQGRELDRAQEWRQRGQPTAAWAERYHPGFADAISFLDESQALADRHAREEQARQQRELDAAKRVAEERTLAAKRQRRWLIIAVALLGLSIAGLVWGAREAQAVKAAAKVSDDFMGKLEEEVADKQRGDSLYSQIQIDDKRGDAPAAKKHFEDALKAYEDALEISKGRARTRETPQCQQDLASTHETIGNGFYSKTFYDKALKEYRDSLPIREHLARSHPEQVRFQRDLASVDERIGDTLTFLKVTTEAIKAYSDEAEISERMAKQDSDNLDWQRSIYYCHASIGGMLNTQGKPADALAAYRQSLAVSERQIGKDPANLEWQKGLYDIEFVIGDVLKAQNKFTDALAAYRQSLAVSERLTGKDPANLEWQKGLCNIEYVIGEVLKAQNKFTDALAAYRQSLVISERLTKIDPANLDSQKGLYDIKYSIGETLAAQGKPADALAAYRESLAISERLTKTEPANLDWQKGLCDIKYSIGETLAAQDKPADALAAYHESLAISERLTKTDPANLEWQKSLYDIESAIGETLKAQGKPADALAAYRNSLAVAERAAKMNSADAVLQNDLAWGRYCVAMCLRNMPGADQTETARLAQDGVDTMSRLKEKGPLDSDSQDTLDKLMALQQALVPAKKPRK